VNILVIDDSAVDRYHLVSLLKSLGHAVDQCAEPGTVIELMVAKPYKVVFLDVVMPDFDGYRLLRNIRLNPAVSNQYVVICSVKKTPLEINYGIERAGANNYLPKPATREGLEDIFQQWSVQCS
jgi:CheY-like chemotaxis protein